MEGGGGVGGEAGRDAKATVGCTDSLAPRRLEPGIDVADNGSMMAPRRFSMPVVDSGPPPGLSWADSSVPNLINLSSFRQTYPEPEHLFVHTHSSA
jgi:hypothetical protein